MASPDAIYHALENRSDDDLGIWLDYAHRYGGPIVDVGAGAGRVSLPLLAAGFGVIAVDIDQSLLNELHVQASFVGASSWSTVRQDARELSLSIRVPLVIVPQQTVQMLGPAEDRRRFFERAAAALRDDGVLVCTVMEPDALEPFDGEVEEDAIPDPDTVDLGGVRYESTPVAVLLEEDRIRLLRERWASDRNPDDVVVSEEVLYRVTERELIAEAASLGLVCFERRELPATEDHCSCRVVAFRKG